MSTKIQYFCDRCGSETKSQCPKLRITNSNNNEYCVMGEVCPACMESLLVVIADWKSKSQGASR